MNRLSLRDLSLTPIGSAIAGAVGYLLLAAAILFPMAAPAADESKPADGAAKTTYDEHVRAIFREHCFTCHNQDAKKSDLALDSFAGVTRGGSTGQVVEPGNLESSRLWALVSHTEEPHMPPEQDKLSDAKLATIKNWIGGGALENNGSVAKVKKQPAIDLGQSAGANKPSGPPAMPEGLWRQPMVTTVRPGAITALAASPWAPLIAVAGQKQILLYHSNDGRLLGVLPFPEGSAFVLKFSRSGSLLLAGGGQGARVGRVAVYDVRSGKRVFEVGDELDTVLAADINENHTRIALGGPGRVVRIFSTADGSMVSEIRKHTDWIYALEFSPDGVLLATADRSGGLFVWESETAREYQNLQGHKGAVTDVSWRLDSNLLASASEDGAIKLWEMENGAEVKSWGAHAGGVAAVRFGRDGRVASVGRDRTARLWDGNGAAVRAFEPFGDIAMKVALTHDAARLVAGDWLGDVRLCEVAEGKLIARLSANPPTLETMVQSETARVAAAAAAQQKAAADLAAAQVAVTAATDPTAKAQAKQDAAAKAAAQKAAADALAAAQTALQTVVAEKAAYDQAHPPQSAAK
jgi:WD40 repeat protein